MLKGFKDFIMRGNVVDLAVAVVIGAAFGSVVTAFTEKVVQPIINSFGGASADGLGFFLVEGNDKTYVDFSAVISQFLNFLLVAAVIYFVLVVPMNKYNARKEAGDEAPAEDIALLREIRDSLRK